MEKKPCVLKFSSNSYNIILTRNKDKLLNFWIPEVKDQNVLTKFLNEKINDRRSVSL